MQRLSDGFGECRPWDTGRLQDNTNLLNNLKENLINYEKGFKKYSIKTRSELPQIKTQHVDQGKNKIDPIMRHRTLDKGKTKTGESKVKIKFDKSKTSVNKSVELQPTKSQKRFVKSRDFHKRGLTSMEVLDKQNKENKGNKETITTERKQNRCSSKKNFKSKVFLIAFDQQHKYRRLKKREIHQMIFGERQRQKYQETKEIR